MRIRPMFPAASLLLAAACAYTIPAHAAARVDTLLAGRTVRGMAAPQPFSDTLATWSVRDGQRRDGTTYTRSLSRVHEGAREFWRMQHEWRAADGHISSRTQSDADLKLLPLRATTRADRDSAVVAVAAGRLVGFAAPGNAAPRTFNDALRFAPYGPDYSDLVISSLPLKPGYRVVLAGIAPFKQGEPEVRWDVNVVGRDSLETAGAWRDCWKVEQRVMYGDGTVVTLWVDQKTRRLWQKSGAPAGSGLTWFHRVTNP